MTTTKTSRTQQAQDFIARCADLNWRIQEITDSVVTITKRFTPCDREQFTTCDMEYYDILDMVPFRGGSVWGTDGGGIGGMSAMANGFFKMNKSGSGGKKFAAEVRKLLGR